MQARFPFSRFPPATQLAQVVFAFFGQEDAYFPSAQKAMIDLQLDALDGLLDRSIGGGSRSIQNTKTPISEGSAGSPTLRDKLMTFFPSR
jgi:hypothetical protein